MYNEMLSDFIEQVLKLFHPEQCSTCVQSWWRVFRSTKMSGIKSCMQTTKESTRITSRTPGSFFSG